MSVETIEDAEALQVLACSKAWDGDRYIINGSSGFRPSDVDTMDAAGDYLERMYGMILQRK